MIYTTITPWYILVYRAMPDAYQQQEVHRFEQKRGCKLGVQAALSVCSLAAEVPGLKNVNSPRRGLGSL